MISIKKAEEVLETHARGLLPLVRSDASLLHDVLARPLALPSDRESLADDLSARLSAETDIAVSALDGPERRRVLRRFRHRAVVRIALREVLSLADVAQTSLEMSHLAAVVIDAALDGARAAEAIRYGVCDEPLAVMGMGKLGGLELNLGSDIDLVFFYETDGAEVRGGQRPMTVHELYTRIVRRATQAMSEITDHGFCFRVDLRLRPEGTRGPLVNSLASAERYYASFGRSWERAAFLRARPVAGDLEFGRRLLDALRPFVFRREVDPSIAVRMHEMLCRSRRELAVDEAHDVKLGRGGIREAEFFVQTLQLIWGGRHQSLRVPGTLEGLHRLNAAGLVTDREADTLIRSWALLRRVEHRIHIWTGYQTHQIPSAPEALGRFAQSLAFPDADALRAALSLAQREVTALFTTLLPGGDESGRYETLLDLLASGAPPDALADCAASQLPLHDAIESSTHLARMARHATGPFGPVTRETRPAVGRTLLREVAGAADPDAALRSLASFFDRLGRSFSYDRMLLEKPRTTRRLIGLFGASGTLSRSLIGHPEDLDLLLSSEAPNVHEIERAHARLIDSMSEGPDPERTVRQLRRLKRTFTLQIGLAYVAHDAPLELATDRLSALADAQVGVALEAARRWANERFGPTAGASLLVVALGKLGGQELGFGGDLDLVFLYDRDGETARGDAFTEVFTRTAQRTMQLLRQRDAEGPGYETDTRLRPSGSKGTLVVSFAAFDAYHNRRAASWERQALIRARCVAGDAMASEEAMLRFGRLAYEGGATEPEALAHLRGRMQRELAGENAHRYHPKLGFGGLVDVELLVQWLQMRHGKDVAVRTPNTVRAIEKLSALGHLDRFDAEALRESYDLLRGTELALKLFDAHREPLLEPRGRTGAHVARLLQVHARDGLHPAQVLARTHRAQAETTRALFDRVIAPVQAPPPWGPGP